MAEIAVILHGLATASFTTGLILNKYTIYGIVGGENLASCLVGWKTPPTTVP